VTTTAAMNVSFPIQIGGQRRSGRDRSRTSTREP
jgi:hypothetical protein